MKKISLLIIALMTALLASAQLVSQKTAADVASRYWADVLGENFTRFDEVKNADFPSLYIFNINDGQGFVIVASDSRCFPILGYSTNSTAENMGPETRFWLNQYEQEIEAIKAGEVQVDATLAAHNQAKWNDILNHTWLEPKSASSVPQLMTTTWNQSPYYNQLCPNGTPAGCLAIAVAQMMRYWGHPIQGSGSHSYSSTYGTLSADFGSTTYDWANMPNSLRASSTNAQKTAVATLCYHVGVAMDMGYAPEGSGAYVTGGGNTAEYALKQYFGYKNTLNAKYKYGFSEGTWVEMLKDEISAGRPVVYAGYDAGGGHAFVFDGYNTSNLFHVNWGWGGYYDGYYAMGALNPSGGGTGSNATNTFNSGNHALFGVEPIPTLRTNPSNINLSADAESATFTVVSDGQTSASWHATSNASWLTVTPTTGAGMGTQTTVTATAQANTTGAERHAMITIAEGSDTARVAVHQLACSRTNMCPITVKMASTSESGWCDATLTLESTSGTVYGTATLYSGVYAEQTIDVCSDTLVAVWHRGSSDNVCSFELLNGNDVIWISHDRSENVGDNYQWVIADPCGATGGVEPLAYNIAIGAAGNGEVFGAGSFELGEVCELLAVADPGYRFAKWNDNSTTNPRSFHATTNRTITPTFVKIGTDTLQFENGFRSGRFGRGNDFCYGIKLNSADLMCHSAVSGVKFYACGIGSYNVRLYEGGENGPDTMVYQSTRNVTSNQENSWVTVSFHDPIAIHHNKPLWVVIRPVGVSDSMTYAYYGGNTAASWFSTDGGSTWQQLDSLDQPIYGTWMIRTAVDYISDLYSLSSSPNRPTWGKVTGGGRYHYGEIATLVATPAEGYCFQRWTDKAVENPHEVVVVSDTIIRAVFAECTTESIDGADIDDFSMYVQGRNLHIQGAEGQAVAVFDLMGRQIFADAKYGQQTIVMPTSGVFMVRVNDKTARKVVVY